MKILNFRAENPLFTEGLMEGLQACGHEVHNVHPAVYPSQAQIMEQKIDEIRPDIITTAGIVHLMIDAQALWSILPRKGIPHVYWAVEDTTMFDGWSMYNAVHADFVFTIAPRCVAMYAERGVRADVLEWGCNPRVHYRRPPRAEFEHDVVLVANNHVQNPTFAGNDAAVAFRASCTERLILPLVRGGYDVKLFGLFWDHPSLGIPPEHIGGGVSFWQAPDIYSSAKIVLGVEWDDTPGGHLTAKTWEVLGGGAFHLAPYTPAQARHFAHGRHLVHTRSADETLALVDYYLSHPKEREEVAAEGQREVYARHTYRHRGEEFAEKLRQANIC